MSTVLAALSSANLKPGEIAALSSTAVVALLAILYPDRRVFSEKRPIPNGSAFPLVGALPYIVYYKDEIHDLFRHGFEHCDALTLCNNGLGLPTTVMTIDPRNIEHVLKTNFENYVKGPMLYTGSIDLLGHGIFNANGEVWKYQRKTASLIFNIKNFRDHFTAIFMEHIDKVNKLHLDKAADNGTIVDFQDIMMRFTLDSFVQLGFGVDVGALQADGKVPFAEAFDVCQRNVYERFVNSAFKVTEFLEAVLLPWRKSQAHYTKVMNQFAYEIIQKRRDELAQGREFKDLLSRFMNAKNEHGDELSDQELRDVVMNFIIAGRDTTGQTLSWCLYCLIMHPRVETKLLEEITTMLHNVNEADPVALHDAIKNMKYAHAVLYETLRLHPPVPANQKYAIGDDVWPDGTTIKKNDTIMWSMWSMSRNTRVWGPDAHEFRPERWLTDDGDLLREGQGKWPAFHAGPRVCLGQQLATLESLVALTQFMRRYKFTLVPGHHVRYHVTLTMPIKDGLRVLVEHRQ